MTSFEIAAVAGRGHEQHLLIVGFLYLIQHRLREPAAAPAVRQDSNVGAAGARKNRLHLNREIDRVDRIRNRASAARRQKLQAHHGGHPVHACDADGVVADRADRAGYVRAVIVVVHRIAAPRDGVEPMGAGGACDRDAPDDDGEWRRRRPDVRRQVGMGVVNAGINDGDDVRWRPERDVPRFGRANVGARRSCRAAVHNLADILQSPQVRKQWVIRLCKCGDDVIWLGIDDIGSPCQRRDQRGRAKRARPNPEEPDRPTASTLSASMPATILAACTPGMGARSLTSTSRAAAGAVIDVFDFLIAAAALRRHQRRKQQHADCNDDDCHGR